jgi:hypothetical protein
MESKALALDITTRISFAELRLLIKTDNSGQISEVFFCTTLAALDITTRISFAELKLVEKTPVSSKIKKNT